MHTYSSKVECKYNHYSNFISSTILDYSKKNIYSNKNCAFFDP